MRHPHRFALLIFSAAQAAAYLSAAPAPAPECTETQRSASTLTYSRAGTPARRTTSSEAIKQCGAPGGEFPIFLIPVFATEPDEKQKRKPKRKGSRR